MTTPSFIPCHSERWSRRSRRILKSAVWRILQNYFHGEKVLPRLRSNRKSNARKGTQIAWGKTYLVSNLTLYRKFIHELWKSVYDHAPLKSSTMIMIKYPTINVLLSNSNIFKSAFVINVTQIILRHRKDYLIFILTIFSLQNRIPHFLRVSVTNQTTWLPIEPSAFHWPGFSRSTTAARYATNCSRTTEPRECMESFWKGGG